MMNKNGIEGLAGSKKSTSSDSASSLERRDTIQDEKPEDGIFLTFNSEKIGTI